MTISSKQKQQFTTGEVATLCGVTLRTVINWIKAGRLEAYQLPGTRGDNRVPRAALVHFFEQNSIPKPPELSDTDSDGQASALIVDDDKSMSNAIERVLRRCGYKIFTAADGFQAGQIYAVEKPIFMTLDLQMPRTDGFKVLESLKDDANCFICVISGMGRGNLDLAKNIRANEALEKPFDNETLESLAKAQLEKNKGKRS